MSAKPKELSAERLQIRKLMAEQTEFGLAVPPPCFRQSELPGARFPAGKRRQRSRKIVPMLASQK